MTDTANYTTWAEALRSGEFQQVYNSMADYLFNAFEDEEGQNIGYCCLGVAEVACLNESFIWDDFDGYLKDSMGEYSRPFGINARRLGLHEAVTQEEQDKINALVNEVHQKNALGDEVNYSSDGSIQMLFVSDPNVPYSTRRMVLSDLNDTFKFTFDDIAMTLEKLGWDVPVGGFDVKEVR